MIKNLLSKLDSKYVKICSYGIVAVLITFVCALLILRSRPFFVNLWSIITAVLKPVVFGLMIWYLVSPVTDFIESKLKFKPKTSRIVAVIITIGIAVIILIGGAVLLYLALSKNLQNIDVTHIEDLYQALSQEFATFFAKIESLISSGNAPTPDFGDVASSTVQNITETASTALFSIIFAVHFLLDGKNILSYWNRFYNVSVSEEMQRKIKVWAEEADTCFSGYIRGQFIDASVVGVLCSVVLSLLGVPYAPVVGLLTGFGNLIPYLGGVMGFGSLAIACLISGSFESFLVGGAAIAVVMAIDSNIINPKLLSKNVNVHPILVVASLIAGGAVGGLAGMLIAVPTGAFLKLQMDHYIERKELEKQTVE